MQKPLSFLVFFLFAQLLPAQTDCGFWAVRDGEKVYLDAEGKEKLSVPADFMNLAESVFAVSSTGEVYGSAFYASRGFVPVFVNGKTQLMRKSGEAVLPDSVDFAGMLGGGFLWTNEGGRIWRVCGMDYKKVQRGKWGLVSPEGKVIFDAELEMMMPGFVDGHLLLKKDGKYALMNENAELVIGFELEDVFLSGFSSGSIFIKQDQKWFRVDASGELVGMDWPDMELISGSAGIRHRSGGAVPFLRKMGKDGLSVLPYGDEVEREVLIDAKGVVRKSGDLDDTKFQKLGLEVFGADSLFGLRRNDGTVLVKPGPYDLRWNAKLGMIDWIEWEYFSGEELDEWDDGFGTDEAGWTSKRGLLDSTGAQLLAPEYDQIAQKRNTDLLELKVGVYTGLANEEGKILAKPKFRRIDHFVEGYALAKTVKMTGVINEKGKWVWTTDAEDFYGAYAAGYVWTFEDRVMVGEPVLGGKTLRFPGISRYPQHEEAKFMVTHPELADSLYYVSWETSPGYRLVDYGRGRGLYGPEGWVLPPVYEAISGNFEETGLMILLRGNRYGLATATGEILIDPQFADMHFPEPGCDQIRVQQFGEDGKPGKWGAVDQYGEVVVPFEYEWVGKY